jgi:bacterioferritin
VSRELLTGILNETENNIDWLTHQIRLIDAVGAENYKQEQMFE